MRVQKDLGHRCGGHQGHVKEESQKVMVTIADPETGVYAELDGLDGNAVVRRHAWQPTDVGPDVILATTDANGTSLFLHDANKSVMQATGGDGEALEQYAYAPFGEPLGASPVRIGFSSELFDASTRLAYYNYRYLVPKIGKWIRRDIYEKIEYQNLYRFVNNDSINFYDNLGLHGIPGSGLSPSLPSKPSDEFNDSLKRIMVSYKQYALYMRCKKENEIRKKQGRCLKPCPSFPDAPSELDCLCVCQELYQNVHSVLIAPCVINCQNFKPFIGLVLERK